MPDQIVAPPDTAEKVALPPHATPGSPPATRSNHGWRSRRLLQLQRLQGNTIIARQLSDRLQRQPDAGAPAAQTANQPRFDFPIALFFGPRFDATYIPVGPTPAEGELEITLNVFVELKDFDLAVMQQEPLKSYFRKHPLTKEQRKGFAWPKEEAERKAERKKFGDAFKSEVESAWSGKHTLRLQDADFAEYQCRVKITVNVIEDEAEAATAHNRIKVQKIPEGIEERFRPFVQGKTSVMDYRDADRTKAKRNKVYPVNLIKQIGPFAFDKADLTPDMEPQIAEVEAKLRELAAGRTPADDDYLGPGVGVSITGRASSRGTRKYNEQLSQRRINAVHDRLGKRLGWGDFALTIPRGEEHASEEERFQRVDVHIGGGAESEVTQILAAHEAGHMFGLDDEYVDEQPTLKGAKPKFEGDEQDPQYQEIKNIVDEAAAKETVVHNSGSIMALGSQVQRGHYVYFVKALNQMTEKKWKVE